MAARGMRAATVRLFQTTIDCGLLRTKQQLRMVMRNAADPRLSTPLKGRHESPNFRKPFYLVEPHRHLGPSALGQLSLAWRSRREFLRAALVRARRQPTPPDLRS
jgi:hypothetical protein